MTILDLNGVHRVKLMFCDCHDSIQHPEVDYRHIAKVGWMMSTILDRDVILTRRCIDLYDSLFLAESLPLYRFVKCLYTSSEAEDFSSLEVSEK